MAKAAKEPVRFVAQNRKARHEFFIEDTLEAGIALTGSEVKSLREGRANLGDSYARSQGGELWLVNAHISEYRHAGQLNHEPLRPRKLLLHRREIDRLAAALERQGLTLVPLGIYFNARGRAKVELALARGKKKYDKRETEKKRDWGREKARLLRAKG